MFSATKLVRVAAAACAAASVLAGQAAAAEQPPLDLTALTGRAGTDLSIEVPAETTAFDHVHVRVFRPEAADEESLSLNLKDVEPEDGVVEVDLRGEPAGAAVVVSAQGRAGGASRTTVWRGRTTVRMRPDLTVASIEAYRPCPGSDGHCLATQALTTQPIDVVAVVEELNGETGAVADVTLSLEGTPLRTSAAVSIGAGDRATVRFEDVELTTPATTELTVTVAAAAPAETDTANNAAATTVEMTEHELERSTVLVPALGGYGAQFNQHLYAPVTNAPPASLPDLEGKVRALEPQLVRIFYNDNLEERQPNAPRNLQSFKDTVGLAQAAGATINITYQAVNVAKTNPVGSMTRFADVLHDLVRVRGYTNVIWVTVANEPNSTALTMPEYETLYRALDDQLWARGLRPHIRFMAGDLIRDNQRVWFQYIAANMSDIVDAYSVHIYWSYWDLPFAQTRLKDVAKIVNEELPESARKPVYVTEMGVRGILNMPGKPTFQPGYWADGTQMTRTNIAGFQQLWFDIASAQLGFAGSVKWDAYWSRYDANYNQVWYLIGPAAEGWPLFPSYHALRLLLRTTDRDWSVVRVQPWADDDWDVAEPDEREKELAAYVNEDGDVTVLGVDTDGRDLNGASAETRGYSIGGLPASTNLTLALWNATGDGTSSVAGTVATNAAGVARFSVPLHAAFSLTTMPVS